MQNTGAIIMKNTNTRTAFISFFVQYALYQLNMNNS